VTSMTAHSRAWAEISTQALSQNITLLRHRYGPVRLMAVVKADAYGHGMSLVAPVCATAGVTDFGVATLDEGIALRALLPEATIFIIALTLPAGAEAIVAHRLVPFISTLAMGQALAAAASAQGVVAEAHWEVDTGIGRAGASVSDTPRLLDALDHLPGLRVTGLVTHFASADEDPEDAEGQHQIFTSLLAELGPRANTLLVHAANSPAALTLPDAQHHLLRPGLLRYGIEPMPGIFPQADLPLRPVLSLKTRVLLCRMLPGGSTISYGRTYTVPPKGGLYATLGIGYGDGFPRALSNIGHVLLHGQRAPIRGRVCMDQIVVDVTNIPSVQAGDVATLIGTDGSHEITVGDLAAQIGTTPHAISTCLSARIPRVKI
jgi:alanine racemase